MENNNPSLQQVVNQRYYQQESSNLNNPYQVQTQSSGANNSSDKKAKKAYQQYESAMSPINEASQRTSYYKTGGNNGAQSNSEWPGPNSKQNNKNVAAQPISYNNLRNNFNGNNNNNTNFNQTNNQTSNINRDNQQEYLSHGEEFHHRNDHSNFQASNRFPSISKPQKQGSKNRSQNRKINPADFQSSREAAEKEFLIHTILQKQLNQMRNVNYKFERRENEKIAKYFNMDINDNDLAAGYKSAIENSGNKFEASTNAPGFMSQDEDFGIDDRKRSFKVTKNRSPNELTISNTKLHSLQQPVFVKNSKQNSSVPISLDSIEKRNFGRSIQHNVPENVSIRGYVGSEDRYSKKKKKPRGEIINQNTYDAGIEGKLPSTAHFKNNKDRSTIAYNYNQDGQFPEIQPTQNREYNSLQHQDSLEPANRSKTTVRLRSQKLAQTSQESGNASHRQQRGKQQDENSENNSFDYSQHMAQKYQNFKGNAPSVVKDYRLVMNQTQQLINHPKFYNKKYVSPRRLYHQCAYCQHKNSPQFLGNLSSYQGKNLLPTDVERHRHHTLNKYQNSSGYLRKGQNNLAHRGTDRNDHNQSQHLGYQGNHNNQEDFHNHHHHHHNHGNFHPNYESDNQMIQRHHQNQRGSLPRENQQQDYDKYYYSDQQQNNKLQRRQPRDQQSQGQIITNYNPDYAERQLNNPQVNLQPTLKNKLNLRGGHLPPVGLKQQLYSPSQFQNNLKQQNDNYQQTQIIPLSNDFGHTFNPKVQIQEEQERINRSRPQQHQNNQPSFGINPQNVNQNFKPIPSQNNPQYIQNKNSLHNSQSPIMQQSMQNQSKINQVLNNDKKNQSVALSPLNIYSDATPTQNGSQLNNFNSSQVNSNKNNQAQQINLFNQTPKESQKNINTNLISKGVDAAIGSDHIHSFDHRQQANQLSQNNSQLKFPILVQNQGASLMADYDNSLDERNINIGDRTNKTFNQQQNNNQHNHPHQVFRTEINTRMDRKLSNREQMHTLLGSQTNPHQHHYKTPNHHHSQMGFQFGQFPSFVNRSIHNSQSPMRRQSVFLFGQSPSKPLPAKIQDDLYDRLMGRSRISSHICSTNHHGHNHGHPRNHHHSQSPKAEPPILNDRRDESTSPMSISQKNRRSMGIETEIIRSPDKVSVEIQTYEVENKPEEYMPKKNQDWAQSQIYKYVYKRFKIDLKNKDEKNKKIANPNDVMDQNDNPLQIQDNFNPDNKAIYTEIEATYKASLLKKKARTYNQPDQLEEFHEKAKTTIEVLTANMITADVSIEKIFEHYSEINRSNVIKLLLRCRMLYVARFDVKAILLQIIKKEKAFRTIEKMMNDAIDRRVMNPKLQGLLFEGLRISQRLLSQINQFKHEHKIFKGTFIFKKQDYSEVLMDEIKEMEDFIEIQGLKKPQDLEEEINRLRESNDMMMQKAAQDSSNNQDDFYNTLSPSQQNLNQTNDGPHKHATTLNLHLEPGESHQKEALVHEQNKIDVIQQDEIVYDQMDNYY